MTKKIARNIITNANIYLDGKNFLDRAEEVKLPDVTTVVQEHKALEKIGKVELPYGFDKLTSSPTSGWQLVAQCRVPASMSGLTEPTSPQALSFRVPHGTRGHLCVPRR